jgi:mRNA interferase RelE/StbE
MASYSIEIKRSAAKEIEKLPADMVRSLVEKIGMLSEEPRPQGCKKLSGEEKYRIRVGNYRILYEVMDMHLIVYMVKVSHRKEMYK